MILTWGELLWDVFPARGERRLGGCAANVAYHLAQLGTEPLLVSRVGDDVLGKSAITSLRGAGVSVAEVQIDPDCPTGTVTVDLSGAEPTYSLAEQAAWDRIEASPRVLTAARSAKAIVFGTLAQRTSLVSGALNAVLEVATGPRVCDLNLRAPFDTGELIDWAIPRADVLKLNEHEAARVSRALNADDPVDALLKRYPSLLVIVTLGERGAELACAAHRVSVGAPAAAPGGDSVGAGDAFTAAIAALIAEAGRDRVVASADALRQLGKKACAYASATVAERGATPIVVSE